MIAWSVWTLHSNMIWTSLQGRLNQLWVEILKLNFKHITSLHFMALCLYNLIFFPVWVHSQSLTKIQKQKALCVVLNSKGNPLYLSLNFWKGNSLSLCLSLNFWKGDSLHSKEKNLWNPNSVSPVEKNTKKNQKGTPQGIVSPDFVTRDSWFLFLKFHCFECTFIYEKSKKECRTKIGMSHANIAFGHKSSISYE